MKVSAYQYVSRTSNKAFFKQLGGYPPSATALYPKSGWTTKKCCRLPCWPWGRGLLWSWNISMGIIDPMKCSYGLLGTAGQAIWAPSKLTHRCRSRITILKNPGLKTPKKYGIGRWHKVNTVAETSSRFGVAVLVMFEVSVLATATQLCLLFWKLSICWSIGPFLPLQFPETLQKDPKKSC